MKGSPRPSTEWIWNPGVVTRNADGSFAYVFGGEVLAHLSRPYAPAIGGDVDAVKWDGATLTVTFHVRADVAPEHDVFWNAGTPSIACDGAAVTPSAIDAPRSLYTIACGGDPSVAHAFTFTKAP